MLLYLNISALAFILIVAFAIVSASYKQADSLFYIRTSLLLIPAFAQVRQVLVLSDTLHAIPLYIYIVYFLLRLIGPLINAYGHILVNKPVPYKNVLFILTYVLFGYMIFDLINVLMLPGENRYEYIMSGFTRHTWFSFSFPLIQLAHIFQALWVIRKTKGGEPNSKHFISIAIVTSIIMLGMLQLGYLITDRENVELVLAPIIFIVLYTVLLMISVKYSTLLNKDLQVSVSAKLFEDLSKRENQVLQLMADGKSDKEIADGLNLSVNTVATYCRRIYNKLGVNNRTEATALYLKS